MSINDRVDRITAALEAFTQRAAAAADHAVDRITHYLNLLLRLARVLADATYRLVRAILVTILKLSIVVVRVALLLLVPVFAIAFGLEILDRDLSSWVKSLAWMLMILGALGCLVPILLIGSLLFSTQSSTVSDDTGQRARPRYYGIAFIGVDLAIIAAIAFWTISVDPKYEFANSFLHLLQVWVVMAYQGIQWLSRQVPRGAS